MCAKVEGQKVAFFGHSFLVHFCTKICHFLRVLDADNSGFLDLKEFLLAIDLVAARYMYASISFEHLLRGIFL